MKKNRYNLLSLAVISALYSTHAQADLREQCLLGVSHFTGEVVQGDQRALPVNIEADRAEINQPVDATYTGDVIVTQGNRTVKADQVRVEQPDDNTRRAYLNGAFDYRDNLIAATGNDAAFDLNSKDADFNNADYQLIGQQGRGTAEQVEMRDDVRVMKNASFTSCLPNDNSWQLEASEMKQHVKEEYAELWHARFKVLGVPIFYSPYLQFPIGDRRRSGLLIPSFGNSSRDGVWYSQPIYWNIAPNFDATFTPVYYSDRGWQIKPEFRYLTRLGEGTVAAEYMNKDRLADWTEKDRSRHLIYWRHNMSFLTDWRFSVDYTRVSDKRYFSDFDSDYGSSTDGYATQNFKLSYYQPNYNISISGKQFQVFDDIDIGPYRALPQIDFNYYQNNVADIGDFKLYSQISHFDNDSKTMPSAWRFHLEPTFTVPLANRYGSLNLETKLYATYYQQKSGTAENAEQVERSVSRVLPQIKLDFKTILANSQAWVDGFTQTLEPRVQYVYRPYKNQSNIGAKSSSDYLGLGYDSALLQQDYFSLFNDRRYSGLDRIASANQITVGGTTRFFKDSTGQERFNFSLGQIFYLTPSKIDDNPQNSTAKRSSSWAAESNWKFHPQWNFHGSYQYDTRLNETSLASAAIEFKPQKTNLVQLTYRYASKNYIDQNLTSGSNRYGQDIKQVGIVAAWEVTDNIAIMAGHYQDVALKKAVESKLGINYNTCCWSVGLYTARQLVSTPSGSSDTINDVYYDNKFAITFELRGFGANGYNSGLNRLLNRGIIPYTDSFNIN